MEDDMKASDSKPDQSVVIVPPRVGITTCYCGAVHWWLLDEDRWECNKCGAFVFQKDYVDTSAGSSW